MNLEDHPGWPFPTNLFRVHFDPINRIQSPPECDAGGIGPNCRAVGQHPLDPYVLDPTFDRTIYTSDAPEAIRYDHIMRAIEGYSKAVGTLAAHELGHGLGVAIGTEDHTSYPEYPDPYPPYHAFGGYTSAFPLSTLCHLFLRSYEPYGYFPAAAASIMDAGLIGYYAQAIHEGTGFTSFDKAYLLQKTFYTNDDAPHWGCSFAPEDCLSNYEQDPKPSCFEDPCIDECPAY